MGWILNLYVVRVFHQLYFLKFALNIDMDMLANKQPVSYAISLSIHPRVFGSVTRNEAQKQNIDGIPPRTLAHLQLDNASLNHVHQSNICPYLL